MTILNWRIGDIEMGIHTTKQSNGDVKVYNVVDGRLTDDVIKHHFEPAAKTPIKTEDASDVSETFSPSIIAESIVFISSATGYNRDTLKSFINRLRILFEANREAGESIYIAYVEILREVHKLKNSNTLTEETIQSINNRLDALKNNMNQNYGAEIKSYRQKLKVQPKA